MSNFRNVSTSEPCPICGKPDWCSIQYVEGGEKLHYCRRILCGDNIISRIDNHVYVFIKQAKDGSSLYKEEQAYLSAKKKWLESSQHPNSSPAPKEKPALASDNALVRDDEEIIPLENRMLDKIYRSFLRRLYLHREHVYYFLHQGWSRELIVQSMVRSLPPPEKYSHAGVTRESIAAALIREFGSLKGVPGFYETADGKWTFAGARGILLPLYDCEKNLYRLRIRLEHPETDENGKEKNKYKNFSSYHEILTPDQKIKNAYNNGCRAGSHIGFYGSPGRDDYTVCYITEGEKKAIFANHVLHHPVISIPGVNSFNKILETFGTDYNVLDYLSASGCRVLVVAYDSDKYVNEAVLMYEQKLVDLLTKHGFQIALAYWNPGFGKGLDDILSLDVRPNYEMVKAP